MKKLYYALIAVFISFNAYAVMDTNRTVTGVGTQFGQTYFTVSPATSTTCLFDVVYIDSSTPAGKLQYALLLSAYSSGMNLKRFDYAVTGTGQCFVSLVAY